jgi:hypothetical protein
MTMAMAVPAIQGLIGGGVGSGGGQYKSSATSHGGSAGKGALTLVEPTVTIGEGSLTPALMSEILGTQAAQNGALASSWAPVAASALASTNSGGSIYQGNISPVSSMMLPIALIGGALLLIVVIIGAKKKG